MATKVILIVLSILVLAKTDGVYSPPTSQALPAQQQVAYKPDETYGPPSAAYSAASGTSYTGTASGSYPTHTEVQYAQPADETEVQPYSNSQALENPAYDPNLYQSFVPQDTVQQYVNSYGGPYAPGAAGGHIADGGYALGGIGGPAAGGIGGYPIGAGYPGLGGPYGPGFGNPAGFSVQSGYEGFLVPSVPPPPPPPFGGFFDVLGGILPYPRSVASIFMRSGSYLLSTLAVVLFGGAVTTALCTFTPLCTITFAALPFLGLRDTAKTIKETLSTEITSDRVARAAEFVKTAIAKYKKMQIDVDSPKKEATTVTAKKTSTDDKKE